MDESTPSLYPWEDLVAAFPQSPTGFPESFIAASSTRDTRAYSRKATRSFRGRQGTTEHETGSSAAQHDDVDDRILEMLIRGCKGTLSASDESILFESTGCFEPGQFQKYQEIALDKIEERSRTLMNVASKGISCNTGFKISKPELDFFLRGRKCPLEAAVFDEFEIVNVGKQGYSPQHRKKITSWMI
eukprot:TRINITY_DN3307_c0_g1_i5.p1 TRINITY_DN3307_c0_g1~~TRINITY_DN3307_c0_g1_i5.p1  ORF type:complete len:188 (+),score=43.14 TRINITY_DN3307_c0_g1_i5:68-631(+)